MAHHRKGLRLFEGCHSGAISARGTNIQRYGNQHQSNQPAGWQNSFSRAPPHSFRSILGQSTAIEKPMAWPQTSTK
jgi:hypothetical protein